ncbi:hypothetical protein [Metamycoplasma canadense]|uniref:Uncharacterized protein n=1 Tax=Metamycoplasma canadense TaxID=29554 RepID=A0A077L6R1_9BACT|nr:hypothetical protein [Metamycoplasma canadense]BAP39471.1 hypothetical protein MCAN360_0242 [Metamycoplasma canadense]
MDKETKTRIKKDIAFNIFGFFIIFLFLAIGIILFLTASNIFGQINKGGRIASYVFGSIFILLFILIIIKIFLIIKQENKYAKNAVDVNKIFSEISLSEEEKNINNLFLNDYSSEIPSLNIYFAAFAEIENKHYKKEIDITSPKVRMLMQKMIIDGIKEYGFFDLYLVIDFSKSLNKKFIWKGDLKKYKIYFEYIREIYHAADDYIYEKYITKN